jgi:hypothetical protein
VFRRDVHGAKNQKTQEAELGVSSRIRPEAELDGNCKDDEVENGGAGGLGHKNAHERDRIPRAIAPTASALDRIIPVSSNREARNPTQRDESRAPGGTDGDHEFAKAPSPGPDLEHAKVLDQQCQLYQGRGDWVRGVSDVKDLGGG